jgi:hypothetical protein
MTPRPTPFDLIFGELADHRFHQIRSDLERAGHDGGNRDTFLLNQEVVTFLRELRPEEGLGGAIDQLVALVHHAYLLWESGLWTFRISPERARTILSEAPIAGEGVDPPTPYYLQWPERMLWAQVTADEPHEPLDGWFVTPEESAMRVLGIFGLHPDRMGFTVVEVAGPRPQALARPDGTPLFASVLPAGRTAGLHSLVGAEELLELAWRTHTVLGARATPARTAYEPVDVP